jgi:Carboxypeptidase regulatory-like domain
VILRRLHLALFATLALAGAAQAHALTSGNVSGVVQNSAGVPQIGAVVQLLGTDLNVLASVYTDSKGRYEIRDVMPGRYAVKALGTSFLPSLRENVRVRSNTVVNLTLNTIYEVMQWLPAQPRSLNAKRDDWAWTLRSAANRPLLRWLEDGPLVVVTDGSGRHRSLKARIMATGSEGTFGESGERLTMEVENTPSSSHELLAHVEFAPNTDAAMESMLGFRQDLGFAGSVQSLAAISIHPEVDGGGADGLQEAGMQTSEQMNLGDEFEAEAGAQQVVARFSQNSPNTVMAALPYASFGWRNGNQVVRYRMATSVSGAAADGMTAAYMLPALSMRQGQLALEHGLHQEIGWERTTDQSGMQVLVYRDSIANPVMEASVNPAAANALATQGDALMDSMSKMLRTAGPDFASMGMLASMERTMGGSQVKLTYANGEALVIDAPAHAEPLVQVVSQAHPRHAQMYALSLSGTIEGTGTRWRASYRWQPADTVTRVAPYALDAAEPYLNLHLRQPICVRRDGTTGVDALVSVSNLLAEGYRPYLLSDGSLILFAENQRAVRAGLAFTF